METNLRYIEFIGPPGAGKSEIAKRLLSLLNRTGSNDEWISEGKACITTIIRKSNNPFLKLLNQVIPEPVPARYWLWVLDNSKEFKRIKEDFSKQYREIIKLINSSSLFNKLSESERSIGMERFISTFARNQFVSDNEKRVLFDEGIIQKSIGLFNGVSTVTDSHEIERSLFPYLNTVPIPSLTIFITADKDVCLTRMLNRKSRVIERLKEHGKEEILKFLNNSNLLFSSIYKTLKEKGHNVIKIHNSPQKNIVQISQELTTEISKSQFVK